jgi:iron only hydrogenase large subunit-like protein
MDNYEKLNRKLEKALINNSLEESLGELYTQEETALAQLLLKPEGAPAVIKTKKCDCGDEGPHSCEVACLFNAIERDESGNVVITGSCAGCGICLDACSEQTLAGRKDSLAVLRLLKNKKDPVYAMIAPAFSGQFSEDVSSGKLRSAFKSMGFYGMIEVALFADILTLKEALEFDRLIQSDDDFVLTSCCCPMWIAMIKRFYKTLIPHVPPSVSPMVACGRTIKKIQPEAKTVFIGPCLAKKAEAREKDIADAVDYVLTFEETAQLFELLGIEPKEMPEDEKDHSSGAGRIYAKASGVSEAVHETLKRLRPDRKISLRAIQADGVPACKKLLANLNEGSLRANFIEGMGCVGGCVGGPKSLIDKNDARDAVNLYAEGAEIKTPVDNPYVLELLHMLGYETVEALLDRDSDFSRTF